MTSTSLYSQLLRGNLLKLETKLTLWFTQSPSQSPFESRVSIRLDPSTLCCSMIELLSDSELLASQFTVCQTVFGDESVASSLNEVHCLATLQSSLDTVEPAPQSSLI